MLEEISSIPQLERLFKIPVNAGVIGPDFMVTRLANNMYGVTRRASGFASLQFEYIIIDDAEEETDWDE
jgi:hypothetical protein